MGVRRPKSFESRRERGEVVGGGFIVFRRHSTSGRVSAPSDGLPFEHPTLEAAAMEADRLADLNPGKRFCVFRQVVDAVCPVEETIEPKKATT